MKSKIILGTIALLSIAGIYSFVQKANKVAIVSPASNATSSIDTKNASVITENNMPVIIGEITKSPSVEPKIPVPNLSRAITFPATFTDVQKKDAQEKLDAIIKTLKASKSDFNGWIDLGLYRKLIEDYDGARLAWEYAGALQPTNSLPFLNLANLYGYYIHDNIKAENYFAKAIKVDPTTEYLYFMAENFYQDALKDIPKAISVVEQGIKAIPSSIELRALKTSLLTQQSH